MEAGREIRIARVARAAFKLKRAYENGCETVNYPPLYLWIESTSRCNLRCPMCPQSAGLARPPGDMPLERLERLLDQAAGKTLLVSLHFAGEPLMNKNIAALVRAVSDRKIASILHSNAVLLDARSGADLIESGLDQIVFSFDALPREDYHIKRPPARFDATLSRIREFLEIKKRLKSRWPLVTIKSIVFHGRAGGPEAVRELKSLFAGLPVDRFCVETAHTFAGAFAERALREEVYAVRPRGEIHCCALPWFGFSIGWDGRAFACCNDLNGEYDLGDTGTMGLEEIWNGAAMRALRKSLAARDFSENPLCANCESIYHSYPPSAVLKECARYAVKFVLRRKLFPRP